MEYFMTVNDHKFYEENGFIVIKNYASHKLLDEMRQKFLDICNGSNDHSVFLVMRDQSLKDTDAKGEYLINKLQDFLHDDIFWKYCSDKAILDVVQQIIGPNITAVHSMFINKPPNAKEQSSLHPLHQDLLYFPFRPANKIVASWTAIDYTDENNGCLYVIPGSHKKEYLYKHEYPEGFKNKLYHGVQGMDHIPKTILRMGTGDTVFFHPLLLHGSGPNHTKGFRKIISCHYASSDCYYIDPKHTAQEELCEEVKAEFKRRTQIETNIAEIWRTKSRVARGNPGNMQKINSQL